MKSTKRKALSLMLIVSLLLSVVPQTPVLAAKVTKKLADGISKIVVTESSVLRDDNGYYLLDADSGESATFIIEVTASDSNAWASASNAEKASMSNATSSNAAVAVVEDITEENFEGSRPNGEPLDANSFWLEVSPVFDALPGSIAEIMVNVGGRTTSFNVIVPDDVDPPIPPFPTITITTENGKTGEDKVEAGKTLQLTASILPEDVDYGTVEWYSSVPTVAEVDQNGLVTALQPGLTTIGFTLDGMHLWGSNISILVTPAKAPDVLTEQIEIISEGGSYTAGVGETRQLYANSYPYNITNREIIWSSSDDSIAMVTPGEWSGNVMVTGVKAGKVTITATAADGSGVSQSVNFEILDIDNVTNVIVNGGRKARIRMKHERNLHVTTDPVEAAGLTQEWTSSNPDIFEAGAGWIYGISEGTATLSVTIKGVTGTCEVEVWAQQLELALSRTKMNLQVGTETKINALITKPDVGSIGMTKWKSSNPDVLEITEGVDLWATVKAKSTGTAILTATLDGKEATCEITVTKDAVKPTPADKIDAIVEANLDALESGTEEEREEAVANIITAVQNSFKDIAANTLSADDVSAIASVEELLLEWTGKFAPTQWENTEDADLLINEVIGALLNLPTDWSGDEPVQAVLNVGKADITGLKLPEGVTGAKAYDIKLWAASDSRSEELSNLNVPIEIKMDVPEEFLDAKNLWVYNYHGNEIIKIQPTVKDGEMSIGVKKFSTFVLMDIPAGNNNNNNNNNSSSGSSTSSSARNTNLSGQWAQDATGWWFKKTNGGYPQNEWAMINNKWYHFNNVGYMETGWILLKDSWYYLKAEGDMAEKEWVTYNGKQYYLHENGTMMSNQWFLYSQNWYYMGQDGSMMTNTTTPDGYKVDSAGVWVK